MFISFLKDVFKEIKTIINSYFFWILNILFFLVFLILFLFFLPFNDTFTVGSFIIGPIFVNILIAGISIICQFLTEGLKKKYDKSRIQLYTIREYLSKSTAFIFLISIIFSTIYPLGIIVVSTGSLSFKELHFLYFLSLISGLSFTWIGFFIKARFRTFHRRYISFLIRFFWVFILLISNFLNDSNLYLKDNIIYINFLFAAVLFLSLLYWSYRKNILSGGGKDGIRKKDK